MGPTATQAQEARAAEAAAKRDAVATVSPTNAVSADTSGALTAAQTAAASDFNYKFLDALGVARKTTLFGLITTGFEGINPETAEADVRAIIDTKTPDELLDAIAKADPSTQGLVDIAKANPALAESFHNAVVKDPTVLEGLKKLTLAKGEGELTISDIENTLKKGGSLAVNKLAQTLDEVAETDLDFNHVLKTAENGKKLADLDFKETLYRMKHDPEGLIKDLFANSDLGLENSDWGIAFAGILKEIMPMLANILDLDNGPLKEFVDLGKTGFNAALNNGQFMKAAATTGDGLNAANKGDTKNEFTASVRQTTQEIMEKALKGAELAQQQNRTAEFTPALGR